MTTNEDIAVLQRIAASLSADLMDGGVTCAAIEQEDDTRTREHLLSEEGRLLDLEKSLRAHLSRTINRAEKAEAALADVHERDETVARLEGRLADMTARRDSWRDLAENLRTELDEGHECDPTVTDAKVERAWHVSNTLREDRWPSREEVRQILTAAHTEPAPAESRRRPPMPEHEYTPTDDEVREDFAYPWEGFVQDRAGRLEAYDRWLRAHDAQVKRDAARSALDGMAAESMGAFNVPNSPPSPTSWAEVAGAVDWYHARHYPKETSR